MFHHQFVNTIEKVPTGVWQQLAQNSLFCGVQWLQALENSGCVNDSTGWQPKHLVIYRDDKIVAILPGYLKTHSYGEYVFDWAWADAYAQHGVEYYPKWLCGVPFTPITNKRILCNDWSAELQQYLQDTLCQACTQLNLSSIHINFLTESHYFDAPFLQKEGVQFHWFNKNYTDFNGFLHNLTARKRKMIKKERAAVRASQLTILWLSGEQITTDQLQHFFHCYQMTYLKRSGHHGYLNFAFFSQLLSTMPEHLHLCLAYKDQDIVAASFFLNDRTTLYGRYWGALDEYQFLHFELCYYQGIDYAILNRLACFDAGAQGEHKLARGFEPINTFSQHFIAEPMFAQAIAKHINLETEHMRHYKQQCLTQLPFKQQ